MIKLIKYLLFRWKFRGIIGPPGIPGKRERIAWELITLTVPNPPTGFKYVSYARPPGSDYIPPDIPEGAILQTSIRGVLI